MNTHTLLHLIQSPNEANQEHLASLEEELRLYPYFQALHVLKAKALGTSQAIKQAAAYTADRGVLMRIINSDFNPDVNLPNIDHLDIQPEDLNAFDRLAQEDDDEYLKSKMEALAAGIYKEEEPPLERDDTFDDTFGEFNFDEPNYESNFDMPETEHTNEDMPDTAEGDATAADTDEAEVPSDDDYTPSTAEVSQGDTDEPSEIDADLLANIEALRKSRQSYMDDDTETTATLAPEDGHMEIDSDEEEAPIQSYVPPHIRDEEDEEVNDPALMESLAALRKTREDALERQAQAEARMEAEKVVPEDEAPEEEPSIMETPDSETYAYPDYQDPFTAPQQDESATEEDLSESPEQETPQPPVMADAPAASTTAPEPEQPVAPAKPAKQQPMGNEDLFGVDTSLFDLDSLLDDDDEDSASAPFHAVSNEQSGKANLHAATKTITGTDNQLSKANPTVQQEDDGMTLEEKIKAQNSIISSFIERPPKITPNPDAEPDGEKEDLASQTAKSLPTFVSENLASIMVRQGKYDQAIKIYKQLILKYPDKKAYFADLIENLENK